MSKSNTFENACLLNWYNNEDIANLGDATGVQGSSAAGTIDIALHTADPGEGGSQTTNEATYTGYSRPSAARSSAGFTVSGNQVSNTAEVDFGARTAGSENLTHFSFGYNDVIIHSGALTDTIAVGSGSHPKAAAGALTATED